MFSPCGEINFQVVGPSSEELRVVLHEPEGEIARVADEPAHMSPLVAVIRHQHRLLVADRAATTLGRDSRLELLVGDAISAAPAVSPLGLVGDPANGLGILGEPLLVPGVVAGFADVLSTINRLLPSMELIQILDLAASPTPLVALRNHCPLGRGIPRPGLDALPASGGSQVILLLEPVVLMTKAAHLAWSSRARLVTAFEGAGLIGRRHPLNSFARRDLRTATWVANATWLDRWAFSAGDTEFRGVAGMAGPRFCSGTHVRYLGRGGNQMKYEPRTTEAMRGSWS
jgi:hypothetical protein